jgi:hypothetical protein
MEKNKRPRYKSLHPCPPDFLQRYSKHTMEKIQSFQQMFAGKTGYLHAEN